MDKKYYYRLLGLTGEAPPDKIRAAYEERVAKLHSSDYNDDPVYAKKKIKEATMAYKILMGEEPPISRGQKKAAFEKFKDFVEDREGNDVSEELEDYDDFQAEQETEKRTHAEKAMRARKRAKERQKAARGGSYAGSAAGGGTYGGSSYGGHPYGSQGSTDRTAGYARRPAGRKKIAVLVIIIAAVIIVSVAATLGVGLITGEVFDNVFDDTVEMGYGSYDQTVTAEEKEQIDHARQTCAHIDYYAMLDASAIPDNYDYVIWGEGEGEYGDGELFDNTCFLIYAIDVYNAAGFFDYITGIRDFFYEYDDADCADALVDFMSAPPFEEVAGAINLYTGEPILVYSEYLEYLESVTYGEYFEY